MSFTLEVIKFRDVIRVTDITRIVPNILPITIELKGKDFGSVEQVKINDAQVPEFVVVNQQTIWAQLPSNMRSVRTLEVVSSNFTKSAEASRIDYSVGTKTKRISGILKLTQHYVMWLLKSPGSDIFNPEDGGGLQDIVGTMATTHKPGQLLGALSRAISRTNEQIKSAQLAAPRLPLDERLLDGKVLDIGTIRNTDEARVRVKIESVLGSEAVAALVL